MDLTNYIDSYGLVASSRLAPGTERGGDNGPLYTAQAILLSGNNIAFVRSLYGAINRCVDHDGTLRRVPGDNALDAPDDHYGVLSAYVALGMTGIVSLTPRLWQPVLVYLWLLSKDSFFFAPLMSPLVAIIILVSNVGEAKSNVGNKLLTWTFVQALKQRTFLPGLAGRFWERRMRRIYGDFSAMFAEYYEAGHPFIEAVKGK